MIVWRARRGRSTVCGSGLGSCFWLRTAWRAGQLDVQLDARPARSRSGGFAMPRSGVRVSTRRAIGAPSRSIRRRRTNASWRCWIKCRPKAMPAGPGRCWLPHWVMSMSSISGAFCVPRRLLSPGANLRSREQRPRVCCQGRRCGWALHGAARECDRHLR